MQKLAKERERAKAKTTQKVKKEKHICNHTKLDDFEDELVQKPQP